MNANATFILPLFCCGSGVVALVGLVMVLRTQTFIKRAQTVQGRYVARSTHDSTSVPERTVSYAVVEFQTADGRAVQFEARTGTPFEGRKIGQTIMVRYDPQNPQKAVVATFFETWGPALIILATGVLMGCIALAGIAYMMSGAS